MLYAEKLKKEAIDKQSEIGTAPRSVSIPHRGMQRGYFGNGKGNFLAKMYFQTAGEK